MWGAVAGDFVKCVWLVTKLEVTVTRRREGGGSAMDYVYPECVVFAHACSAVTNQTKSRVLLQFHDSCHIAQTFILARMRV